MSIVSELAPTPRGSVAVGYVSARREALSDACGGVCAAGHLVRPSPLDKRTARVSQGIVGTGIGLVTTRVVSTSSVREADPQYRPFRRKAEPNDSYALFQRRT
jgi:hypothetical protein